LIEATSLYK